jgi:eukaryotic-like serine/threonine-protein kinase
VPRENLVGQTIGGYTLDSEIGEGGTSAVFRATHPVHGSVAVKILREKLRTDKTAIARFRREAQYGNRVVHPRVVRTIEIGEVEPDGLPYLVIEWAAGDLLEKYAKRRGPLPPDEVAGIIEQIAEAVHAAHTAGIVHRDLKPDNVMYDPATRAVKLLDFGIAADTDTGQEQRLTRAGFFVGTLMYVAPEALSGELVGPMADQYSLGTIAYFLLCGCHPFTAKTPREMFSQLLSQPPIPLNQARPGLRFPAGVEAAIMRALAKDPAARHPDVRAFAAALTEGLAGAGAAANTASGGGLLSRVRSLFKRD